MSTQNFDRTYFADGQFSRKTNAALQQGVRAILFAALTTNASIAGAQDAGAVEAFLVKPYAHVNFAVRGEVGMEGEAEEPAPEQ